MESLLWLLILAIAAPFIGAGFAIFEEKMKNRRYKNENRNRHL